jgi:hypothetical protein
MPSDTVYEQIIALFDVIEHSLCIRQDRVVVQYQGYYIQFFQASPVDFLAFFQIPTLLMVSQGLIFLAL